MFFGTAESLAAGPVGNASPPESPGVIVATVAIPRVTLLG